jgi:hypothetical protein
MVDIELRLLYLLSLYQLSSFLIVIFHCISLILPFVIIIQSILCCVFALLPIKLLKIILVRITIVVTIIFTIIIIIVIIIITLILSTFKFVYYIITTITIITILINLNWDHNVLAFNYGAIIDDLFNNTGLNYYYSFISFYYKNSNLFNY